MNFSKQNCCFRRWCFLGRGLLLFAFVAMLSGQLQAQIDPIDIDPDIGGGGGGGVVTDDGGIIGGSGGATLNGNGGDIEDAAGLDFGGQEEDNRNAGFTGATSERVTARNFVGATSPSSGGLAENASFGGGVNAGNVSSVPGGGGAGGGGGGGAAGNANAGLGGAGGFTGTAGGGVVRSSIRTRLRPVFASPVIPPQITEFNFNDNLARQPTAQSLIGRYQVSIQNRKATVTGVVNSQADADRLIRQLRLQPGVYGVINQLQVIR